MMWQNYTKANNVVQVLKVSKAKPLQHYTDFVGCAPQINFAPH